MVAIKSDTAICRCRAISFNLLQKASSRLTLVSRPPMAIERLTIRDLIDCIPHNANGTPLKASLVPAGAYFIADFEGLCGFWHHFKRIAAPAVVAPSAA